MRRVFRRLKEKFKVKELSTPLLKRIVLFGYGKVKLQEEHDKMLAWCDEHNEKPSLLRYNHWIHNAVKFKEERKQREPDDKKLKSALELEDERSKERLRKFHNGEE